MVILIVISIPEYIFYEQSAITDKRVREALVQSSNFLSGSHIRTRITACIK